MAASPVPNKTIVSGSGTAIGFGGPGTGGATVAGGGVAVGGTGVAVGGTVGEALGSAVGVSASGAWARPNGLVGSANSKSANTTNKEMKRRRRDLFIIGYFLIDHRSTVGSFLCRLEQGEILYANALLTGLTKISVGNGMNSSLMTLTLNYRKVHLRNLTDYR